MVSATQWQVDMRLLPDNPNQRVRYYPAWPGGMRAFGWHPVPLTINPVGSPAGWMSGSGISGPGLGFSLPDAGAIATGIIALGGVIFGGWLAYRNLKDR